MLHRNMKDKHKKLTNSLWCKILSCI